METKNQEQQIFIDNLREAFKTGELNKQEILDEICKYSVPNFNLNASEKILYLNLRKWFDRDKSSPFNLKKGLFIMGKFGNGKTTMMRIFSLYAKVFKQMQFSIKDAGDIVNMVGTKDVDIRVLLNKFNEPDHVLIDDLGQTFEDDIHFGKKVDIISSIIDVRYRLFCEDLTKTHCITNLDRAGLGRRFKGKILDRFKEMFNMIEFLESSKRGCEVDADEEFDIDSLFEVSIDVNGKQEILNKYKSKYLIKETSINYPPEYDEDEPIIFDIDDSNKELIFKYNKLLWEDLESWEEARLEYNRRNTVDGYVPTQELLEKALWKKKYLPEQMPILNRGKYKPFRNEVLKRKLAEFV